MRGFMSIPYAGAPRRVSATAIPAPGEVKPGSLTSLDRGVETEQELSDHHEFLSGALASGGDADQKDSIRNRRAGAVTLVPHQRVLAGLHGLVGEDADSAAQDIEHLGIHALR